MKRYMLLPEDSIELLRARRMRRKLRFAFSASGR